ncbi:MAG: hypothetical protein ACQCN4_06295 [Candidatus Bathyarchaeia archaeon]
MSQKRGKGTELNVFKGREEKLNRIIFLILQSKSPLTSYDMYLEIRRIRGFRHTKRQTVDRRMKALHEQGWIVKNGIRPAKAHFLSPLYRLSIRAQAALVLNKTDLNIFLLAASENKLEIIVDVFSVCL